MTGNGGGGVPYGWALVATGDAGPAATRTGSAGGARPGIGEPDGGAIAASWGGAGSVGIW